MIDDLKKFLEKFNISEEDFEETRLKWEDLQAIRRDYKGIMKELNLIAHYIEDKLQELDTVHSVRTRVKNPNHLIAKIIRKRIKYPARKITIENYRSRITDLIGIRAIHLFKEDWVHIHHFIINTWDLYETPIAYIRQGDNGPYLEEYKEYEFDIEAHPFGYRSIHYLIASKPSKELYVAEIQVRTIFEEGWSEIDHTIKYPKNVADPLLDTFLDNFNILAGNSDQMGSFVRQLKEDLLKGTKKLEMYEKLTEEHTELIDSLKKRVAGTLGELNSKVASIEKKMSMLVAASIKVKPFEHVLDGIRDRVALIEPQLEREPQKAVILFEHSIQELDRLDILLTLALENIDHASDHHNGNISVLVYRNCAERFSENIRTLGNINSELDEAIKELLPTQLESHITVESAVNAVRSRSKFVKFLIGPKYKELQILRQELKVSKNKMNSLVLLTESIVEPAMHFVLWTQVILFSEQNDFLESFIKKEAQGVSLFGWLFKFFAK